MTLIQVQGQTVGIAAWDGSAYRFHASAAAFAPLEERTFRAASDVETAARRLLQSLPRPRPQPPMKGV